MQRSFAAYAGFRKQRKITRREALLAEMDRVVPWNRLQALIEPRYPVAGNGRKTDPLNTGEMLHSGGWLQTGKHMKTTFVALAGLLASGGAWQSAALKMGEDTYQVSANASPARGAITGAREMALTNANAKCDSLSKKINVTDIKTEYAFPANGVATVTFTCK